MGNNIVIEYDDVIVDNINDGKYKGMYAVKNVVEYVTGNSKKTEKQKYVRYIGGYGVPYNDLDMCIKSMNMVKNYYNKRKKNSRKVYHIVVSFKKKVDDINIVKITSVRICQYLYAQGFQCLYGVHEDTDNPHIHIAINSTNFITGKQMHFKKDELKQFTTNLKNIAFYILKKNYY